MIDISTNYLGMKLRSPLVASSGPLTGHIEDLKRLEDAGAGAVCLPSLFEEQLTHESVEIHQVLESGSDSFGEALNYFPELEHYNTGPDHYLNLVQRAKEELDIPIIASLNGFHPNGWETFARLIEEAGADALEINIYYLAADPNLSGPEVENLYLELVTSLCRSVDIPIAVKMSPFFSALAHMAMRLEGAGASGLVLFNRFYQPDLDLETMEVQPELTLSTSAELRLPLRWIAILRSHLNISLAATSGVHRAEDVLKALMVGADVAMMTSALLSRGPELISALEREIVEWLTEHEYESVEQLKGSASQRSVAEPDVFERANYMRTLMSYSAPLV